MRRIAIQPVIRQAAGAIREQPHGLARLCKCPKDLFVLWKEFEFGMDEQKPAKDFTATERGKNKFSYSRHKIFWNAIEMLLLRGHTSDSAIDRVYSVYSRVSVNKVLLGLRKDKRHGGNPRL